MLRRIWLAISFAVLASTLLVIPGGHVSGQSGQIVIPALTYNSAAPSLANGALSKLQIDSAGRLIVNVGAGGGAGGTSSSFGAAFPATGTAVGFKDSTGTNMVAGNLDASGFLKVNVAAGSGGNGAASNTGAAVPTQADYLGINIGGNLRGQTGVNPSGVVYAGAMDLTSVNGTTTDSNSGVKSAGTLRVVLATDQPQLTNKLLVTPDANSAVNVAQLAGTTADTNSGVKSAGTLRVVLATDQPALTNKLLVTPDANSAVNLAQVGGTTIVNGGTAGTQSVGGIAANGGSAAAVNPLVIGGVNGGNAVQLVTSSGGSLATAVAQTSADGVTNSTGSRVVNAGGTASQAEIRNYLYNGTTWDMQRSATASPTAATGVALVANGTAGLVSLTTISAGSTNGTALDNGVCRSNHNMVIVANGTITSGTVQFQGSLDNSTWINLGAAVSPTTGNNSSTVATGQAWRYIRAATGTAIGGGGTVTVTVGSSG